MASPPRHPISTAAAPPSPGTGPAPSLLSAARTVVRIAVREPWLSWQFIKNDPWAGLYPGVVFALAIAVKYHQPPGRLAVTALVSTLYFWLYLYTFCLTNQLAGLREDRLNKPFRPLVKQSVTTRGALVRTTVAFAAFPLLGWALGVWQWALLWQAMTLLHNLGGSRHWIVKNAVIGFGVLPMLGAAWQLTAPLTADAWRWMLVLAVVVFLLIPAQDLRDLHGDAAAHRATFPLAFGEPLTRRCLAAGFALLPLVDHFLLIRATTPATWCAEAAIAALCWTIARRVLNHRTPAYDHRTYRYFEYWYAAILTTAFLTL
ncbi:prenyltransferase [Streptomyces adustus]|uniref:Prenyltransferase n=1 Tax=Streptomyces adustus TaxID=1609272 RepID=A0A5N8VF22_9ACTN|nr:UbiA family prenyltransferase [Streptomyces adustus]MPY33791.1 prenyltransferase [Streptomyces adustus]